MSITRHDVLHVATLARLRLSDDEVDRLTVHLSNIVDHVEQLKELDTADVEPTAHLAVPSLPLQPDDPRPSLSAEAATADAPRAREGGFSVPVFVEH